jgi:outer membrane protein assembly factor BamB
VAVFAQNDVLIRRRAGEILGSQLYGLSLTDGRRLWSRAFSQGIAGLWGWHNLVVVVAQPGGSGLVLTGLDASTGQPQWRLPIGGSVPVQGSAPTADGGLAIDVWTRLGDGQLEVVDMSSGHIRWTVPVGSDADPPVAVGGDAVLYAVDSQLTSYDDRTGQVRWTEALSALPGGADDVVWQQRAGLVYLTGSVWQADGQAVQVLLGISAADGRMRWRVVSRFAHMAPPVSLDPFAPGLVSVTTSYYSGGTSQYELDPATGRMRWHVVSPYPAVATPAGIATAPGPGQITMRDALTGRAKWTAGLAGGWLPLVAPHGQIYQGLPVFPAGPLLVVPAAGPDGSDRLDAFRMSDGYSIWQVTIPGPLAAPLSIAPGGMLAYTE